MKNRIIAIGDVHGCFGQFRELIEDSIKLRKSDKLILLGDYIDRGNQSKEVVDYILHLQSRGFNVIPLMGNHEKMLLDAFYDRTSLPLWISNGGMETLKSFGISALNDISNNYIEFFNDLELYYSIDKYLFVHAGFNDEIENPFDDKYSMTWVCKSEYRNTSFINKVIIHGHCPIKVKDCTKSIHDNLPVLNLDTGCVYSDKVGYGKLTALELNTMTVYTV